MTVALGSRLAARGLPPIFDPASYEVTSVWAALYLLTAVVVAAFILFVLVKQPRSPIVRALALNFSTILVLTLMVGLMWSTRQPAAAGPLARAGLSYLAFTGPLQLFFAMRIGGFDARKGWRRLRHLGFGGAATLAVLVAATDLVERGLADSRFGFVVAPGPLYVPFLLFYVVFWAVALALLVQAARASRTALLRRRAAYVLGAYLVGGVAAIDGVIVYGHQSFVIGWATSLLATMILAYAVVQHRLMDITTVAHRTLARVCISLLLFVPLYVLLTGFRRTLVEAGPARVAAVVLGLFFATRVYFARVQPWLDRLLARRRLRLWRAVDAFAARAAELAGPAALVTDLAGILRRLLGAELRAVVLRAPGQKWQLYPGPAGATPRFDFGLIEALRHHPEVIVLDELGSPRAFSIERAAVELCQALGAVALLPLVHRDEIAGLVALGPPRQGRLLTHDEIDFLERLRTAATVAFVNAELYEETESRTATLEEEVRQRTAELAGKLEDLKRAQAELVQTEKMASVGMLVAGVSHEINNALTFVYGNLPTMRKYLQAYDEVLEGARAAAGGLPAARSLEKRVAKERYDYIRGDVGPLVEAMDEGAQRARRIVGSLRSFARPDEAQVGLHDLREGLESTLSLLRGGLGARITFHRDYASDLPRVECHPAQLNQVFLNLLLNATEAIEGQGEVWIRAERSPSGGVLVTFRDSGRGIPESVRPRVWEPFFTTKGPGRGSGLGLTISRTIIERHGGRIEIAADEPRGARVELELPGGLGARPPKPAS